MSRLQRGDTWLHRTIHLFGPIPLPPKPNEVNRSSIDFPPVIFQTATCAPAGCLHCFLGWIPRPACKYGGRIADGRCSNGTQRMFKEDGGKGTDDKGRESKGRVREDRPRPSRETNSCRQSMRSTNTAPKLHESGFSSGQAVAVAVHSTKQRPWMGCWRSRGGGGGALLQWWCMAAWASSNQARVRTGRQAGRECVVHERSSTLRTLQRAAVRNPSHIFPLFFYYCGVELNEAIQRSCEEVKAAVCTEQTRLSYRRPFRTFKLLSMIPSI